jgi:hypothetical protein
MREAFAVKPVSNNHTLFIAVEWILEIPGAACPITPHADVPVVVLHAHLFLVFGFRGTSLAVFGI